MKIRYKSNRLISIQFSLTQKNYSKFHKKIKKGVVIVSLPKKYRTRKNYILTLGVLGILYVLYSSRNAALADSYDMLFQILIGSTAFLAAYLCWPKEKSKTFGTMVLTGVCTIFLAFFFIGLVFALTTIFSNAASSDPMSLGSLLVLSIMVVMGTVVLGPIFSHGVPFIIGIAAAILFVDETQNLETSDQG